MTFEECWDESDRNIVDRKSVAKRYWNSATEAAIPKGYVLVPIEPTEAMLESTVSFINLGRLTKNVSYVIYTLMIKAAQETNDAS